MSSKIITRLLFAFFAVLICAALISYKQTKMTSSNQECTGNEKCEQKKAQTELILLESLSKHLVSAADN